MDLEVFGSLEYVEEEEATSTTTVEAQPDALEEQSPSNVKARVLSELAPQEEVAE